ncbi:putative 3-oxoacyl-reductase [Rhizodiscina lignyota]|uniref:3-oxoacyl-reductase n=1 Tax=Rhizodiscina lignyota TaxID=1504668 RepID=A0A9P4IIH4_9PEZI|nr:putative 3-oxoacyl-reductase [Rhizodiscina lignyota]
MSQQSQSNKVWFVTGCSSGLGKSFASHVYNAGQTIVATARNTKSLSYLPDNDERVLKLQLDVTSKDAISRSIAATVDRFGRIDVVINNAGYCLYGDAESIPEELSSHEMDTLFWGPVQITQEAVRIMREVNPRGDGGVVVQVTSIGGFLAVPGAAFYHAGKHALEGFTKSMAGELNPEWNIRLVILSPGGVKTNYTGASEMVAPRNPAYSENPSNPLDQLRNLIKDPQLIAGWAAPNDCARVVFDLINNNDRKTLPTRLTLGADGFAAIQSELKGLEKEVGQWREVSLKVSPLAQ